MINYEPLAGTHITDACQKATTFAIESDDTVVFVFNGIKMKATPTDSPESLEKRWNTLVNTEQETYRNSPEGRAAKVASDIRLVNAQTELNALIEALPKILRTDNHLDALITWVKELIEPSDMVGVKWNPIKLVGQLEDAGYRNNAHLGHSPQWFDNRNVLGKYIIGQTIDCMKHGHGPHQVAYKFIEEYFALQS